MNRRAVWWIRAQVAPSLCADIAELRAKLEWGARGEEGEPGALAALAVEELVRVYVTRFAQDAVLRDRAPACVTFQVP